MKPKVSIFCITYNHVNFIDKAIEGFLMQKTNFSYEILIHDDASTDGTTKVIKKYENQNKDKIRAIYQTENQYSKSVNIWQQILMPLAQGKYVAICEGDDFWTDENKLQIQVNYMEKHKDCTMCFHLADELSLTDNIVRKGAPFKFSGKCSVNRFGRKRSIIETCTILCRKEIMNSVPDFYLNSSSVLDLPLELHLLSKGYGFYINRNMATHLYMVPGSWSEKHSIDSLDLFVSEAKKRICLFQEFDEETEFKYHKFVQAEIARRLFNIELKKGNIKAASRIRRFCKTNLKSFFLDEIRLLNPQIYQKIINFRHRIRVKKKRTIIVIINKIINSLLYKLLERSSVQGVSFIVGIVLARILSPNDYGVLSILLIFVNIASVFVQSGMGTALVQAKFANEESNNTVFFISLIIAIIVYLILYATAPFIAIFYKMHDLSLYLRVLALMLFPSALNTVQLAKLTKEMRFKNIMWSNLLSTIISGVIGIFAALNGLSVWALIIQQLLYRVIVCSVMWFTVDWHPKFQFNFTKAKSLYKFGWKLLVSGLLDTTYQNIQGLIIGRKFDASSLAFYNRGRTFPSLIISNINGSIQSVLLPVLSKEQDNKLYVKNMMRRSIQVSTFFNFSLNVWLSRCSGTNDKNIVNR